MSLLDNVKETELLRFITAGSVDDGKSTLIGRLLHDCKSVFEDHLSAVERDTVKRGGNEAAPDLSLLVDGLRAEREQGITIDVAYRYFSTPKRKFIIADTPGHEQYTRNMATGASTADLAILLVDARHGVLTQTKRHCFIAVLLGVRHIVVAINKMDLVDFSQTVFESIKSDFLNFATRLPIIDLHVMPISASEGDNVVNRSVRMPWFTGPSLLHFLETIHIASDRNLIDMRFPVQHVLRAKNDFRGYSGTVSSGILRVGSDVLVLPERWHSTVKRIVTFDGDIEEAFPPMAVTVLLADELDVSRGSLIVYPKNVPHELNELDALVVWMNKQPADLSKKYLVKHATNILPAKIRAIDYRMDVNTLHRLPAQSLNMNEIGRIALQLSKPLYVDTYQRNRSMGSFIIIDYATNETVAAGTIIDRRSRDKQRRCQLKSTCLPVSPTEREQVGGYRACLIIATGKSASRFVEILERLLFDSSANAIRSDSGTKDALMQFASKGFVVLSGEDTSENAISVQLIFRGDFGSTIISIEVDDESCMLSEAKKLLKTLSLR